MTDAFGLVETDYTFDHGIVERIADRTDRGQRADVGESVRVADARIFTVFKVSSHDSFK